MAPKERPRIDGASLVDPALHSPALMELLNTELSRTLIGMYPFVVIRKNVEMLTNSICL